MSARQPKDKCKTYGARFALSRNDSGRSCLMNSQPTLLGNLFMKAGLTHHEPQIGDTNVSPYTVKLSLVIQAPDFTNTVKSLRIYEALNHIASLPKAGVLSSQLLKDTELKTYPVQNMTTSAGSSLPSENFRPVSVKPSRAVSFFNLILPSITYWLPPTSSIIE